ncbi:MAG: histidine kinase [Saprospiraceae bacterium]|nr:histidine kinase [Saprospiraceae bacterium]
MFTKSQHIIIEALKKGSSLIILISFLSVLSLNSVFPQSIESQRFLPNVTIDSLFIYNGKVHLLSEGKSYSFTGTVKDEGRLPRQNDPPIFYFDDGNVDSYIKFQDGFLVVVDDTLKYFDGQFLRTFEVPTEDLKLVDARLSGCGSKFAILSNGNLWIWNPIDYLFSKINVDASVIADKCDDWNAFWVSNGIDLYSVIPFESNKLPEITINEFSRFDDEISFAVKAYHPALNDIQLSYRWKESDDEWVDIQNNEDYRLTLPSDAIDGLQVRASVDDEYYSYTGWYNARSTSTEGSQWFWYLLFIPFTIISISIFLLARDKKLKTEIDLAKEKYQLKEQAQAMEFQAQRLKMNPHFLFNAITGIQGLIAAERNNEARRLLGTYAHLTRYLLKQSENKTIALERELKFITDYLTLEQLIFNGKLEYKIINHADGELEIPPMMIQPLVENSIRHGFKGRKHGLIQVFVEEAEDALVISVSDNGIGRAAAAKGHQPDDHHGIAIDSIKSRLENMKKFRKGSLQINDLVDNEGTPTGTKCIISIPI